ncbi:MAG TPA: RNA polymerase sigma factor [Bryobacteraceae bacterium]|nr:RNA polymerase sigma factor [Bryobacteraceae bacterium]
MAASALEMTLGPGPVVAGAIPGWSCHLAEAIPQSPPERQPGRHGMLVDADLIERARGGDDAAFNRIVLATRRRVLGTIARLIGRREDVEDVGQQVFLRLYLSLDQLRTPDVFDPWLYRLTVNAAYDYLRKQRRRSETRMADLPEQVVLLADAAAGGARQQDETEKAKVREFVQGLLASVSEADRTLLILKEVEGLSLKELQSVYHVKENALKVRLFRARQRVLKALSAQRDSAAKANNER